MRTLKILAPDGLNIENCVGPSTAYTTYYNIERFLAIWSTTH